MIAAIYARKSRNRTGVADEQKPVARQVEHARQDAERKGCTVDESSRWRLFRCCGAGRWRAAFWVEWYRWPPCPWGPDCVDVLSVPWNVEDTVERILVGPYAEPWIFDVVQSVVEKFSVSLAGRVEWSILRDVPLY